MSKSITITLIKDGSKILVKNSSILSYSNFFKNLLEEYKEDNEVDLPEIRAEVMNWILKWLDYFSNEIQPTKLQNPLPSFELHTLLTKWELNYIQEVYSDNIFFYYEFLNGVNYLDIPPLLDLGMSYLAFLFKDYSPDDLLAVLNLKKDCTSEEVDLWEKEAKTNINNFLPDNSNENLHN